MRVVCIVVGSLLLLLGLSRVPNLLSLVGHEGDAKLVGHAIVIGAELVIGAGLVVYGVRANPRR
jgi:hypothetical protein